MVASGWWVVAAAAAGLGVGAAASAATRSYVGPERRWARSGWLGAALTGVVFAALAWRLAGRGELVAFGLAAGVAIPLGIIDWCEHRLPRVLAWPQLGATALALASVSLVRNTPEPGLRALAAAAAAVVFFLLLALASGGGVGAGDLPAAGLVGLVTGWIGWAHVAGALIAASVLALVVAVPARQHRTHPGPATVPFGPFLFCGALLMVLVGA